MKYARPVYVKSIVMLSFNYQFSLTMKPYCPLKLINNKKNEKSHLFSSNRRKCRYFLAENGVTVAFR